MAKKKDTSKLGDKLIKIIDERIRKALAGSGLVKKYTGIATAVNAENTIITTQIAGYDTEFEFLNKSGETIAIGEGVKVEVDSSGLTGGYISERFGLSNAGSAGGTIHIENYIPSPGDMEDGDVWFYYE